MIQEPEGSDVIRTPLELDSAPRSPVRRRGVRILSSCVRASLV